MQDRSTELRRALQLAFLALPVLAAPAVATDGFSQWLTELEAEAIDRGISEATVRSALRDIEPIAEILERDRSQPKKPSDFCAYMKRRLTPTRIARGKRALKEHASLLREIPWP